MKCGLWSVDTLAEAPLCIFEMLSLLLVNEMQFMVNFHICLGFHGVDVALLV